MDVNEQLSTGLDLDESTDIAAAEEAGVVVHVRNAKNQPMYDGTEPVTITVAGTYSPTYRRLVEAQRDRMLRSRRASLTGEQMEKNALDLAAGCVKAWQGFRASGQPIPATKDKVIAVFKKFPFVLDQVQEAMAAHEDFSAGS